jgi:hypothetical protein
MKRLLLFAAAAILIPGSSPAFAQFGGAPDPIESPFGEQAETTAVDSEFMIGRWTDDGNCDDAVEFAADGVFRTPEGAVGRWLLEGDRLTVSGSSTLTMRIVPVDDDTINVINPDGGLGRSIRCDSDDSIGGIPLFVT